MNNYPLFIEIENKRYPINTDFRIALECNEIAKKEDIGDYEKCLAIIYKLFGKEALYDHQNTSKIFNLAIKYLRCGKEFEDTDEEPSMDFQQDAGYIKASFMSDYQKDLDKEQMHWWEFYDLLQGLTENSVLNRVRYIREESLSDKKDKEYERWVKLKKAVALKHVKTKEELESDKLWEEQIRKE